MTVQEIKNYALLLSGFNDIPDSYVYIYINQIMNDLAIKYDEAGKKATSIVTVVKDAWNELPANCIAVKRCLLNNYIYDDFVIENGQIKFNNAGTFTMEYITTQTPVVALANTPGVNIVFHEAIAYGVAYKESSRIFMHEDMVEGNQKFILLQEFNKKSLEAATKARLTKKSRQRVKYAPFI